ncbi:winged helix-turn-helix domain-containing protein [Murimonas intestini]
MKNLRSKIEENSRSPKYIQTFRGIGYWFCGN